MEPLGRRVDAVMPEGCRSVCTTLTGAGFGAWAVGGCVRDALLGRVPSDWDVATSASPVEVQRLFRRTLPTGLQHGTVSVMIRSERYEVTTLRGEGAYTDGRRPDSVHFVSSIEQDLERRDFTVNAIAYDPVGGTLVDPFGGLDDLASRTLRAVRDPMLRFREDGLRVLRAARFTSSLEFSLDPQTEAAIRPNLGVFARVSPERVHDEWLKALAARRPSRAFAVMRRTGMLDPSAPPLARMSDAAFERWCDRLDRTRTFEDVRLVAVGWEPELDGRALAESLLAMRWSNRELALVSLGASFASSMDGLDDAALRARLAAVRDELDVVFEVAAVADARGAAEWVERGRRMRSLGELITLRELALTGGDVVRLSGRAGKHVGRVLARALALVHQEPHANDHATLLARAEAWLEEGA